MAFSRLLVSPREPRTRLYIFKLSPGDFLEKLRAFFIILRQRHFKQIAKKCELFSKKVVWNMPLPPTAAALQHFLCAIDWLRESMIDYARMVAPLQHKLEEVMAAHRCLVGPLFSPKCGSGPWIHQSLSSEMLVCRGGTFTMSQINWSVVEKEGYPIAWSCGDLEYLLDREKGFHIYCDHSNLIQIFAPGCRYTIEHIPGELNLWADIISPHRGENVMIEHLSARFLIKKLAEKVSKFVRDCLLYSAGIEVMVAAILDWFKRFGLPETWESDNGSHFKAETIERINRDILQVLRVMLLEYQLDTRSWFYMSLMIQANLNHSPVASLGNHAPIEVITGLLVPSVLDTIAVSSSSGTRLVPVDPERVSRQVEKLRLSLQSMHREANTYKETKRLYAMARSKGSICNFEVGDFVLWSVVDSRLQGNKLLVPWVDPFRVVEARQHSFIVEHLLTRAQVEVHGSRLKFYSDSSLDVTADLKEHVAKQGIVLGVRVIVDHRRNPVSNEWEMRVAWVGLEDIEDSCEPLRTIFADVAIKVQDYIDAHEVIELQEVLAVVTTDA
ncbi:hypothetical protein PHMEG_00025453 [Phytophthora megakarya]|uniref:Reverse transcriptase RNase H-like domain-containing protein n=1 Tax=Phytophthora megakarya TaxID=4795 RepID=A0A225VB32_9STRA|nr:hypothetical protein PHMEG_00025453 [Phytophthora megakarya]